MNLLYFLILFMNFVILFQLNFTFNYSTINKKNFNFNKTMKFQTFLNVHSSGNSSGGKKNL